MINNPKIRAALVWSLRIVIGVTFMISGLAKAIDAYGTIFKLEEYFTVWNFTISRQIIVAFALFLSGFEFVSGLLLAVGAYKRTIVWLLTAFMTVMLFLTLYIWIADPVSDCGCFGDFIILSNATTFWKNVIIIVLLVPLLYYNRRIKGFYHPATQWGALALSSLYILLIGLYGYNVQPIIDFRSFKVDTPLISPYNTTIENNDEFVFLYEQNGVVKEFTLDSLPDDTWTFVDRKPLFSTATSNDKTELMARTPDGASANEILSDTTKNFLIIAAANPDDIDMPTSFYINRIAEIINNINNSDIETIELIGLASESDVESFRRRTMTELELLISEPTIIKELARGAVSLIYIDHGIIKWKRTMQSINYDALRSNPQKYLNSAATFGIKNLAILTALLVICLGLLYLCDVSRKLFRKAKI